MKSQDKGRQMFDTLATILILAAMVSSAEIRKDLPTNDKETVLVPSVASLTMEARGDRDGVDLNAVEGTSAASSPSSSLTHADSNDKSDKPIVLGSTSKVAIVYSERKPVVTEKSVKPTSAVEDRSWRVVKVAGPRDSYLDALNHSHSSKDPREGVVGVDVKPKVSKLIRREYSEGPVYRPVGDQYGAPKEPSSSYGSPSGVKRPAASKNIARISYGAPTQEPFLPTPGDAYSLPVQSSVNFNNNNNNNNNNRGSYAAPQVSYGAPSSPDTNYGVSSHFYTPAPLPQNSYGPPPDGFPPAASPQQAYGPPSPAYGAPYAIQDYSQHLPSLPSIDFSWPFALKLNAFTLAKILLKLVIFKMIVKFIAVICLLLFIPKLEILKKGDKDDNDDDNDDNGDDSRRDLASDSTLKRLNILTALVTSSIEKYENETREPASSGEDCTSFVCRMRKFITFEESWNDYEDQGTRTNRVQT